MMGPELTEYTYYKENFYRSNTHIYPSLVPANIFPIDSIIFNEQMKVLLIMLLFKSQNVNI
jgi:hypothetical protein